MESLRFGTAQQQKFILLSTHQMQKVHLRPLIWVQFQIWMKPHALKALDAASNAFDKGKGEWPTMKVADRIACMERFVTLMKTQRRYDC